jgi:MFS family permease
MHGLYLLWWVQERHISPAVVASILAAGDLVLLVLEIPTGWLADRFGHRASLIAGSLSQVAGMIVCWWDRGVPGLITASLLVAMGDAFRSGADQALIFRTCAALGRDADFQKIEARTRSAQLAALVGLVLAGGAIVTTWGFDAGWAAETGLCLVGLALACAMGEPPASPSPERDHVAPQPALRRLFASWPAVKLVYPAAFLGGVASAASFFAQTGGHGNPAQMTALVATVTLAEAAGSALAIRAVPTSRAPIVLIALGAGALALMAVVPAAFLPCVVVLSLLLGVAQPLRAAAIQRLAADDARAQMASVAHACDMVAMLVALPVVGIWQKSRD